MGEIKSVKVDNWGVFFLQKLQNFFNKTDYCDLTLQFRDNSQLKVHRLVLSACTDYFNVLEQTCEVVDDAIIMPNGLQADVVVPIVNFMYTGTLEFELKMYNRLLRTAKDMNMTVLLKLLEAHRRTMEMHPQKSAGTASPKPRRRNVAQAATANVAANTVGRSLIQTNQGKRLIVSNTTQQRNVSAGNTLTRLTTTGQLPVRQIGSTTFTRIKVENDQQESNAPTAAGNAYTLLKQSPQQYQQQQPQQPTSPFEQLRKGYNNNKRPAVSTFVSPPAKKPNLEDVKEFAEQQRMRKQIAAEYGDDDYDASNIMDDDTIHNDDDDDEMMASTGQTPQTSATSATAAVQTVASQNQLKQSEDPPGTTTIIVKHEGADKPPTIVVKDNSNSKMNHAKIISEVLRQYPHLVKSNKNIKLKIMPNAGGQAQKIIVKKEPMESENIMQPPASKVGTAVKGFADSHQQQPMKSLAASIVANRPKTLQPQQQQQTPLNTAIKTTATASTAAAPAAAGQPQKRRIDSKTMHALIALGAENTTGPWLCLRCGRNGHPISIPSYRGFRRHLINTHKEVIDPALCEHCGWRSSGKRELHFHMQLEHKVRTNLYIFPECQLCQQMCIDSDGLNQHLIDSHPDENKQQCIYCNKIFPEEIQLYTHMKTFHKKQALEDGIIDYSDDENQAQTTLSLPPAEYEPELEQEQKPQQQAQKKINILSDISLPIASSIIKTDTFVQQHEATTSAEEYLQDQDHEQQEHSETKFVSADGSEVILTAEQRKEILSQLNQEHEGSGVVMVVNEQQQQYGSGETQSEQGAISHDETSQATTATNEERDVAAEDQEEEQEGHMAEEDDDNQIYNEMKALHSNLEDESTSQTEAATEAEATNEEDSLHQEEPEHEQDGDEEDTAAEHGQRPEHMDESKESVDNLEWAENLISEHDLADDVSQTTNENTQSIKAEKNKEVIKDDDNKSQDEISKKLKELTGDWSEDDDEDITEEEPLTEIKQSTETAKEMPVADVEMVEEEQKKAETEESQRENAEFEDHVELLSSLQSAEKETDTDKTKKQSSLDDSENIDEDDIDMALKSLHKDIDEDDIKTVEAEGKEQSVKEAVEKEAEEVSKSAEKIAYDTTEEPIKKVEVEEQKSNEVAQIKNSDDDGKPEEKLTKELETLEEQEAASSSTMEVDEETKKDLIDSLLSEQAETMEDTATETPVATAVESSFKEEQTKATAVETEDIKPDLIESEFLNISPDEITSDETSTNIAATTAASITTTTAITTSTEAAITTEVTEVSSASTKEDTNISPEERVKSLISEWGDDEDDDENDADLTANL